MNKPHLQLAINIVNAMNESDNDCLTKNDFIGLFKCSDSALEKALIVLFQLELIESDEDLNLYTLTDHSYELIEKNQLSSFIFLYDPAETVFDYFPEYSSERDVVVNKKPKWGKYPSSFFQKVLFSLIGCSFLFIPYLWKKDEPDIPVLPLHMVKALQEIKANHKNADSAYIDSLINELNQNKK